MSKDLIDTLDTCLGDMADDIHNESMDSARNYLNQAQDIFAKIPDKTLAPENMREVKMHFENLVDTFEDLMRNTGCHMAREDEEFIEEYESYKEAVLGNIANIAEIFNLYRGSSQGQGRGD